MAIPLKRLVICFPHRTSEYFNNLQDRVVRSRIFEFIVGPEKAMFKIHSAAVAEQSDALNNLINGAMVEAQVGRVIWDDLEVETFLRFIQYAYLGDYPTPACQAITELDKLSLSPPSFRNLAAAVPPNLFSSASPWSLTESVFTWKEDPNTNKSSLFTRSKASIAEKEPFEPSSDKLFKKLNYPRDMSRLLFDIACDPPNEKESGDYTPVFLAHAQLYAFADKYGIVALKKLTLHKIHKTLATYKLSSLRIDAIIGLIRFSFSDENTSAQEVPLDDLRELVAVYVATEIKTLGNDVLLSALLEENGAFLKLVWPIVLKKIS